MSLPFTVIGTAAALAALPVLGGPAELRCRLADPSIAESSGVAAASWSDDLVFTNNDSGDTARFFAVDTRTCATLATYSVNGAENVDWEDMARGTAKDGTSVLWLADIGDNRARRASVVVYEVAEPGVGLPTGTLPLRAKWTLTYPDGARDAETLLIDPETARPVVVSKDAAAGLSRVYRLPVDGSGMLEPLARIDVKVLSGGGLIGPGWSVTGGATSPDRSQVVLRTYLRAWVWGASPGESLATVLARRPDTLEVPLGGQAEAISFTRDGSGVWLTSEGAGTPLQRVPLTATRTPATTPTPAGPVSEPPPNSERPKAGLLPILAVGTGALILAGVTALAVSRRPRP